MKSAPNVNDEHGNDVNIFPQIIRTPISLTPKELSYHQWYMDSAIRASIMSHCVRRVVGAVLLRDGNIISSGWNGMPEGFDNICELDPETTNPLVRHAERNALERFMGRSEGTEGCVMYVTSAPCLDCAVTIKTRAKLSRVVFKEFYRTSDGVEYLLKNDIEVLQFSGKEMYKCSLM